MHQLCVTLGQSVLKGFTEEFFISKYFLCSSLKFFHREELLVRKAVGKLYQIGIVAISDLCRYITYN